MTRAAEVANIQHNAGLHREKGGPVHEGTGRPAKLVYAMGRDRLLEEYGDTYDAWAADYTL